MNEVPQGHERQSRLNLYENKQNMLLMLHY